MEKPKVAGSGPIMVEMEAGKKYAWCSCGRSSNQPFCDGSHNATSFRPVIVQGEAGKSIYFCTCKQTCQQPECDGSHNKLNADEKLDEDPPPIGLS